jgi:hypothetical protein
MEEQAFQMLIRMKKKTLDDINITISLLRGKLCMTASLTIGALSK